MVSNADLDEFLTNDEVLDGLYRLLPTTSFFFISNPNDISHYLLPSTPIIFLLSIAPINAIGF
jgi:hypothetical protein